MTSTTDCPGCPGGLVAMILVEDWIVAVLADAVPKETFAAAPKPVPVIVTVSPPASDPWLGETLVTVETAHDEGVGEATFVCGLGAGVVAGGGLAVAGRRLAAAGGRTSCCCDCCTRRRGGLAAQSLRWAGNRCPAAADGARVPVARAAAWNPSRSDTGSLNRRGEAPREATMGADVLSCGAGSANVRRPWLASNATVGNCHHTHRHRGEHGNPRYKVTVRTSAPCPGKIRWRGPPFWGHRDDIRSYLST